MNETSLNLDNVIPMNNNTHMSLSNDQSSSSKKRRRLGAQSQDDEDIEFDLGEALRMVDEEVGLDNRGETK